MILCLGFADASNHRSCSNDDMCDLWQTPLDDLWQTQFIGRALSRCVVTQNSVRFTQ